MRTTKLVAFALITLSASACYDPFSNEDLVFRRALPSSKDVAVDVPTDTSAEPANNGTMTSTAPPPGVAQFYWFGKTTSEQLNGYLTFILGAVENMLQYPPTIRETDRRVWGPFTDKGNELVVTIERAETSTSWKATSTSTIAEIEEYFTYRLEARHAGSSESFVPIFSGSYAAGADIDSGIGVIFVDFESVRMLGMDENAAGYMYIAYDNRFGQRTTEMAFDTIIDPGHPFEHADAAYRYHEENARRDFFFVYEQNIAELPQPDTGPEQFVIVDRFLPDSRGRADVVLTGGDLTRLGFTGNAIECWDTTFMENFYWSNISDQLALNHGSLGDCGAELQETPWDK